VAGVDRLLPWLRRSGWAYGAAALALALLAWRVGPPGAPGGRQPQARPVGTVALQEVAPSTAPAGMVHVAGEVRRPGVYPVAAGARVIEAIRRAGGPTRRANMSGLNLAAALQDGQQVVVPARVAPGAASTAPAPGQTTGPLSLSSASAEDLERLDGIGPTLAGRIVEWRTAHGGFASVEQLLGVSGIGPTRLDNLRPHVVP
jgi:competence protein ComEA